MDMAHRQSYIPSFVTRASSIRDSEVSFALTIMRPACILSARMENLPTNYDLSALDTEAMRSRLSELGSYL